MRTLQRELKNLENRIQRQDKIIQFLCKYNRDDIVINNDYAPPMGTYSRALYEVNIKYIYGGQLHDIDVSQWTNRRAVVLKDLKQEAIIGVTARGNAGLSKPQPDYIYFVLDKASEKLTQITDEVFNALYELHPDPATTKTITISKADIESGMHKGIITVEAT